MHKTVLNIIKMKCSDEDKAALLDSLSSDIEIARGILSGKYKYCPDCNDYYLAKSFLTDKETKEAKICIWEDPINSGGNEYADGHKVITYSVCPKGHKQVINVEEKR